MKTIEQTSIKAGSYYTIAAASGCVIEYVGQAADGAQLRLGKYQHKPEQEWSFVRVGDNAYRIHCRANNKVVDLVAAGTGRGTWLHLWDDVMGSSQVWVLTRNNDGTVQISSPWASGKCVDTVGRAGREGATLQLGEKPPGDDQHGWTARVRERKGTAKAEEAEKTQPAAAEAAPEEQAQTAGAQPAEAQTAEAQPVEAESAPAQAVEEKAAEPAAAEKPKRRACRTKKAAEAPAAEAEKAGTAAEKAPAPKKAASRKKAAGTEAAPKKRAARTKKTADK